MTEPQATPDDVVAQEGHLGRQHMRGSTLLLFGRIAATVLLLATQVLLVRALSKTEFGAFGFALAITSVSGVLLSLGQGRTLSRFLATYEEHRQYDRMFGALVLVLLTISASSLVLLIGVVLAQETIAEWLGTPDAGQILLVLLILAPLEAADEAMSSLFAVFARPMSIFVGRFVLTPGLRFTTVVLLIAFDAPAILLAVGYVATSVAGLALCATLVVKLLRERDLLRHLRNNRRITLPVRDVFSFSLPSLSNDLLILSMHGGTILLLARYWDAEQVANYRAVFPAGRLNQFVYLTFAVMYLPMAARLFARSDLRSLREAYWHAAVFFAVFSFPLFAMTVPFAHATTVVLFGSRYAEGAVLLAVLSAAYYCSACLGCNSDTLQVLGKVRYLLLVNVSCGVVNLALALLLIPRFGALGVAVSNASVLVLQNVLNQLGLSRALGMPFIGRGYRRPYAVIVGTAAVLVVVGFWLEPPILVALPTAAAASLIVFLLSRRELNVSGTFPELLRIPFVRRLIG